jgi:hypothetical protein
MQIQNPQLSPRQLELDTEPSDAQELLAPISGAGHSCLSDAGAVDDFQEVSLQNSKGEGAAQACCRGTQTAPVAPAQLDATQPLHPAGVPAVNRLAAAQTSRLTGAAAGAVFGTLVGFGAPLLLPLLPLLNPAGPLALLYPPLWPGLALYEMFAVPTALCLEGPAMALGATWGTIWGTGHPDEAVRDLGKLKDKWLRR